MPIIVDTSVAVKWLFDEPLSTQALRLRQMFQEGSHYPLAPDLFACGDLGPIDEHLPFWPALQNQYQPHHVLAVADFIGMTLARRGYKAGALPCSEEL